MIICEHKDKPLEYRYTKRKPGNEFEKQKAISRARLPGFRFLSLTLTSCIFEHVTKSPMYFNLCLQNKAKGNFNTSDLVG